jgi:hypothetical protein
VAAKNQSKVRAVMAFSPGEYFRSFGKSSDFISVSVSDLKISTFITCSNRERDKCEIIFNNIPSKDKTFFIPESSGNHGSSALWNIQYDSKDYWKAVESFLGTIK